MKQASAAALAILASSQFKKAELFQITLAGGQISYFTSSDYPITAAVHPSSTQNTYGTGLIIRRGKITSSVGLSDNGFDLTLAPKWDYPGGPPTFNGLPLLQAAAAKMFDGAQVFMSKIVLSSWADTSPKAIGWYLGEVDDVNPSRSQVQLRIVSVLADLNIQMPRNLVQSQCTHDTYDAGCTLNPATFTVAGTCASGGGVLSFNTSLTQVDHYFDLGRITFTGNVTALLAGVTRVVRASLHTAGQITLLMPLGVAPASGDTFSVIPECLKTQAACTNASSASGPAFNNRSHFRGAPFVPQTETLYDGGTSNPQVNTLGNQGWNTGGSNFSGAQSPKTYTP